MSSNSGIQAAVGSRLSKPRWALHLSLLTLYPLALALFPTLSERPQSETLLPSNSKTLLLAMGLELGVFALVFGLAWLASRATADQLFLQWRGGLRPILRGLLYSIVLRLMIALAVVALLLAMLAAGAGSEEAVRKLRPRSEAVVDATLLANDPIYFGLTLTVVSFVVAGLREELWRAGMLAGLGVFLPRGLCGLAGPCCAVTLAALVFGLGHLTQGWGGAAMTAILGLGLGAVMLRHQSVWEAVFAHGFFNATTFVMLYWLARYHPHLIPGG